MEPMGRLRALFRRRELDAELEAELQGHLALKQRALEQDGIEAEAAARQARLALGNLTGWQERMREVWTFTRAESVWLDTCFGARLLARERVFTVVVLVTLTLGIGANTAVFSLLNGLLWKALPVHQPERLARIVVANLAPGGMRWLNGRPTDLKESHSLPFRAYAELERQQKVFSDLFAIADGSTVVVDRNGDLREARASAVTGTYFAALGLTPQAGRFFSRDDDRPGGPPDGWPAVISDGFWSSYFARRADAIGARVMIERVPFTVIGIAPANFRGVEPGEEVAVWFPAHAMEAVFQTPNLYENGPAVVEAYGRLRPGVELEQASAHLATLSRSVQEAAVDPSLSTADRKRYLEQQLEARNGRSGRSWIAETYGGVLWVLLGAVATVLLIAATNVTNLLLARAIARQKEFQTRMSLGATPGRVRRQLVIEGALLAGAGTVLGALFSVWLRTAMQQVIGAEAGVVSIDASLDWQALAYLSGILAVLIFGAGWISAWRGAPGGQASGPASGGLRARAALVVLQTALSFALLGLFGLMALSLRGLLTESTGFQMAGTMFLRIDLQAAGIDQRAAQLRALREALEESRRQPGVRAAGWTAMQPLSGALSMSTAEIPGQTDIPARERMFFEHRISDGYFDAVGIPILAGRDLPELGSPRTTFCLVSENAARRFFGSAAGALGGKLKLGRDEPLEVIGVVGNAKYHHIREAQPFTVYTPHWAQQSLPGSTLAVRYTGDRKPVVKSLLQVFRQTTGRPALARAGSLEENLTRSARTERGLTILLGSFAGFAILLSMTGIAGVLSYAVQQRRKEIGIRMALGARPGEIQAYFQRQGLALTLGGLVGGSVLSYWGAQTIRAYVYKTEVGEPWVWLTVAGAMVACACLAAAMPARKAARTDPAEILRLE